MTKRGVSFRGGVCTQLNTVVLVAIVLLESGMMVPLMLYDFFDETSNDVLGPLGWSVLATVYAFLAAVNTITHWTMTSRHNQPTDLHGRGVFRFSVWVTGVLATTHRLLWSVVWLGMTWTYFVRYECAQVECDNFSTGDVSNDDRRRQAWMRLVQFGFDTIRFSWFWMLQYVLYLRFDQTFDAVPVRYVLVSNDDHNHDHDNHTEEGARAKGSRKDNVRRSTNTSTLDAHALRTAVANKRRRVHEHTAST